MKKRIVCAMMCVAMVATSLVGCGSKADEGAATDDAAATEDAAAEEAPAGDAAGETGKVYYLNFKPEQADAWVD